MKQIHIMSNSLFGAAGAMVVMVITTMVATATEPCGDLGECKVLIELNTTDGDIGFHFLMDGDDLVEGEVRNPVDATIFKTKAFEELEEQFFTETFVESAEPLCKTGLGDPEDDVVTLEDFVNLWKAGTYTFKGKEFDDMDFTLTGTTELTHKLPAAPKKLKFDVRKREISWAAGDDLGECATNGELTELVMRGVLPMHPKDVEVDAWEIVFEPDVEDGDLTGSLVFSIRVPGDIKKKKVKVPKEYLRSLPDDTPAKIEVGAIGGEDNATFTEIFDICVNEAEGCGDDDG